MKKFVKDNWRVILLCCTALASVSSCWIIHNMDKRRASFVKALNDVMDRIEVRMKENPVKFGHLTSITISNDRDVIQDAEFAFYTNLTSVTIPSSVKVIANLAFAHCCNLTSVEIQEGVKSIYSAAFVGCRKLTDVTIPKSVEEISEDAFQNCGKMMVITNKGDSNRIKGLYKWNEGVKFIER